jgi:cell filamentation protein
VDKDPYVYPGTSVLRNRRNIVEPEQAERFEIRATFARLRELEEHPTAGNFDRAHLQAIHRHIFQDVYEWAGELRSVDIAKPGSPFFARPPFIASALAEIADRLRDESQLRGLNVEAFSTRAGYHLGEINAVHPFREGNGRAQREFVRELALAAGFLIDWSNTSSDLMNQASALSFRSGNSSGLAALLRSAISVAASPNVVSDLPVFVPGSNEIVDRREDLRVGADQSMRILGRSEDGERVFGRCGGGILSVTREVFAELPRVDDTVTLSHENGRDVAYPQERDHGLDR